MDGIVQSTDLDDDMVGPSLEGTKLRSNVYRTENANWQDIDVRIARGLYELFQKEYRMITSKDSLSQTTSISFFNIGHYGQWSRFTSA